MTQLSALSYQGVASTTSFTDAIALLDVADSSAVAQLFLESQIGAVVSDVVFTGSSDAAYLVHDFAITGVFSLTGGIMLSTGDFPGATNTEGSYSVSNDTPGDTDLTSTAQTAFPEAGETQDAVVIEFKVNVEGDAVRGISFDIVFGSDEYPEFSDTNFVDVAAIYVNGVNVALFNDNPSTPLCVIQENVDSGNFINNDYDTFGDSAPYGIEWDGFSNILTVRAALNTGVNTVKIGIADTGDTIYDSGLYLNNVELLSEGGLGGGVLAVLNGNDGDNEIAASIKKEEINLFGGKDKVAGTPAGLDGDVIIGFGPDDLLSFTGVQFGPTNLHVTKGSAILGVDTDQNGETDTTVTLTGDFSFAKFDVVQSGGNTEISIDPNMLQGTPLADAIADSSGQAHDIRGLAGDDIITGGGGDDTIDGGEGDDTAVWNANAANYTLSFSGQQLIVHDTVGSDGSDLLANTEKLQFADKSVIVETGTPAWSYDGLPVGLYHFFIVAFDAAPGVTYMDQLAEAWNWYHPLEGDTALQHIVEIFTSKPQFISVYPLTLSNEELATELVERVIKNSASDAAKAESVQYIYDALALPPELGWTRGKVIYQVFGNLAAKPEDDPTWGNTAKQFANEIEVAKYYTEVLHQSTTDVPTLRDIMAPVTQDTDVSTPQAIATLIGQALMDGAA